MVVPWSISCGACDHCRTGLTAHCTSVPHMAMYGAPIGGSWGGLFSDLVRVPYADDALDLAASGTVDPARVVSHVLDWEQLPDALAEKHLKPVFVRDTTPPQAAR
ncbi:hypothetical protein [Streptomyces narbonensis]|uniref:hypothetical protein n=1 Tax=Streptomyces narbonensis TaxID=67333 RepID=UPI003F4D668A